MQTKQFQAESKRLLDLMINSIYTHREIFLRELISNAVDATQKLKTLSSIGEVKGELGDVSVRVTVDPAKKTLTVTDRGIGMTAEEVDKYINQIAFSGAEEFMAKYQNQAIIGHFGLGFYSSFMVADKVEIYTQSYKEGAKACIGAARERPNSRWKNSPNNATAARRSCCIFRKMRRSMPCSRKSTTC